MRKIITLTARQCNEFNIQGWRQYQYLIRQMKTQLRNLQKMKRSTSKNFDKQQKKEREIQTAYYQYIEYAKTLIHRAREAEMLLVAKGVNPLFWEEIEKFIHHAKRQMDQTNRRVIHGEVIPHEEKVFSIFEPHTEWISKGKMKAPVELGVAVAIVEDEFGFILSHRVMQKQKDQDVAVPLLTETKNKFPQVFSCSFDKGFHSPENQEKLSEILNVVALPKKGRLSKVNLEWQCSKEFMHAKKKHSAVESAINALEVHGLDRCLDRGVGGFKRYVSLAILGRNIQILGVILIKREQRRNHLRKLREAA